MKTQNNTTALHTTTAILWIVYTILGGGINIMLIGFALIIFGFFKGNAKPIIAGALVNMALYLFSAITTPVVDIECLFIPALVWLLFAIAIWKKDKAMVICIAAAVANLFLAIRYFGFIGYLIVNLLLCVMLIISGIAMQGSKQSRVAPKTLTVQASKSNQYESLIKLKDLLDSGAITQEEFDQKKKELLNL
jgi:hypothetical protein